MSCRGKSAESEVNLQELITQQSEDLTILNSKNGVLSYRFWTPLLERYELAREPYMEFRKGIKIETYNDSTKQVESTLTANYAIFLENQELWEAKGNVVGTNAKGQKLETQQLFWNQKTKRIYSNVDSKVTQGSDVIIGVGFESDETFSDFTFRRPQGRVEVDVEPRDSTRNGGASPAEGSAPEQGNGTSGNGRQPVNGGSASAQPSGRQSTGTAASVSQGRPGGSGRTTSSARQSSGNGASSSVRQDSVGGSASARRNSKPGKEGAAVPDAQVPAGNGPGAAGETARNGQPASGATTGNAVPASEGKAQQAPPAPRTGGLTPKAPADKINK